MSILPFCSRRLQHHHSPCLSPSSLTLPPSTVDISTLVYRNSLIIRAFAFFGRISVILYDYLPDSQISTDELLFQSFMLTLSTYLLLLGLRPFLATPPDFNVLRLYVQEFKSTGIPLRDLNFLYRTAATYTKLRCGEVLMVDGQELDTLYFVASGSVVFLKEGRAVGKMDTRSTNRLVGELGFQSRLHNGGVRSSRRAAAAADVVAGVKGAELWAIDGKKLRRLMKQNEEINRSVNQVLANAMHTKLLFMLEKQ